MRLGLPQALTRINSEQRASPRGGSSLRERCDPSPASFPRFEIARVHWLIGSVTASVVSVAIGMATALVRWMLRRRAYRVYELGADDGDHDQVRRARFLQRSAMVCLCGSAIKQPWHVPVRFGAARGRQPELTRARDVLWPRA